ncbi:hypothetical protein CLV49_1855 [Labedella gwakjiensis]|uniref:Excisionase family DNA binding protein n=1 Tax=Labedella gwakjiensis TaxID=390269 RepID=A0A2P8GW99_9MICO|nr:hypothetical protein [Labedella gwakjiensis]PSL38238.1 hypothetical protein CLV49_1855 [Labedella gwakjiensis]RUQ87222.1 hypothetical protein ELQ93_09945 [Labedella gwakjiensis]
MPDITAPELAELLGVTRRHATDLLSDGAIQGRRLPSGAWLVDSDSALRFQASARTGKGRQLTPDSAWALLWELSGMRAEWLTPRTSARTRERIRTLSADQIARAVASRTRAHHFRAANVAKASSDLISTGRAAAGALGVDLMDDTRNVSGYVRRGTASDHAADNFMVAARDGRDLLWDNTLPIDYGDTVMPVAVIAADLAVSTDTRERSGGLRALDDLRRRWLDSH